MRVEIHKDGSLSGGIKLPKRTLTMTDTEATTETTPEAAVAEPACDNGHTNDWREVIVHGLEEVLHCRCGAPPVTVTHEPAAPAPADEPAPVETEPPV